MRQLITFCLAAGLSGVAMAHELPGADSQLQQTLHHLFSLHHLPALIILLVVAVVAWQTVRRIAD